MADATLPLGDGVAKARLKDNQDATVSRVFAAGASVSLPANDRLLDIGNGVKKRLRDMGDGTYAEVIFGK
jgi:hypothetical protein